MSDTLPGRFTVTASPQPDVYTVLVMVAALCLAVTMGIVLYYLMSSVDSGGYGLSLADLFQSAEDLIRRK